MCPSELLTPVRVQVLVVGDAVVLANAIKTPLDSVTVQINRKTDSGDDRFPNPVGNCSRSVIRKGDLADATLQATCLPERL